MKIKSIIALGLAGVLALGAVGCSKEVKTEETIKSEMTKYEGYANKKALITPTELKELMDDKKTDVVLFDIRKDVDYVLGHIEGAYSLWRADYSADEDAYEYGGMRSDAAKMESILSNAGATKDSLIVVYSNKDQYDGTRFYWQLKLIGHENVRVLDGGIDNWTSTGFDTTLSAPSAQDSGYKAARQDAPDMIADLDEAKAASENEEIILIDTRSIAEATGEKMKSGAYRKGRIPNGIWLEYKINLNEDKTFKTAEELRKIYEDLGITSDKKIVAYCQSGVRSSQTYFVLTELLGYENVENYDGSWIQWSFNEDLPLESGELK